MPFGFGNFDFGFSEGNPFGLRGAGVNYRSPSQSSFYAPVGAGLNQSQAQNAGRVLGFSTNTPSFNSYPQPLGPAVPDRLRRPTVVSTPTRYIAPPKPQLGSAPKTAPGVRPPNPGVRTNPQDEINTQVDSAYSNQLNFLNNLYNSYRNQQGGIMGAVGGQFDAQLPYLDQARDELLTLNRQQVDETKVQEKNAIAEARNLYNELGQANRQRYGGTSSTGEFANAIQGREFQRGQNKIAGVTQQNLATLADKARSIEQNYMAQKQDLMAKKEAALSEARQRYEQQISMIDSNRAATEDAKTQKKLELFAKLNSDAQNISNYIAQLDAEIESNTLATAQSIFAGFQQYRINEGQAPDLAGLPGAQYSRLMGGTESAADTMFPSGMFKRPTEDTYLPQGLFLRPEDQLPVPV